MDFQAVVDGIGAMTCVVSVEKLKNGGHGKIRIVTGNRAYIDSIEHPAPGTELLTTRFVPNSEYTRYLTRDLNFEDSCYRAAVHKKCLHAYVHPDRLDAWFNMTFLPLIPDDGDLCYCTYTMEINYEPNPERMSNVSGALASAVLEASLKLSGAKNFEAAMADVIRDVRDLCEAEYTFILLMDTHRRESHVLCQNTEREDAEILIKYLESEEFYSIAEKWEDAIAGSNCIVVKDEQDMEVVRERLPEWYDSLVAADIRTIVLFPLKNQKELLGYIWATNFAPEKAGRIKETLELTTFVLSSQIANYLLLRQLRIMGERDLLTGVFNRNRLNARFAALEEGREGAGAPIGVIFADLNGLKTVNDTEGHGAGDALLRDAADALRAVFADEEIYRAGGDEFAMLLPGADETVLEQKAAALRAAAKHYGWLHFAIGYCTVPDGREIRTALTSSDERMYDDKRRFYAEHPEYNRRTKS